MPTMVVPPEAREQARLHLEEETRAKNEAKARAKAKALEQARAEAKAKAEAEAEARITAPEPEVGRLPPHTPPGRAKPLGADDDDAERPAKTTGPSKPARFEALDDLEETVPERRMSTFAVVTIVVLLLIAVGLVGASVLLEDTIDPRPLLEKLYRQYVKGE